LPATSNFGCGEEGRQDACAPRLAYLTDLHGSESRKDAKNRQNAKNRRRKRTINP